MTKSIAIACVLIIACWTIACLYASDRSPADFNADGIVNLKDASIFRDNYLTGASDYAIDPITGKQYTELNDVLDKTYLIYQAADKLEHLVNQDPNSEAQLLVQRIIFLSGWKHL